MEPSEVSLKLYFVAVDKILGFNIYTPSGLVNEVV
jgi:hypothetical protein